MKLEIARGLFLVGALSVVSLAAAAWQEATPQVISENAAGLCMIPPHAHATDTLSPDQDLLLLMFGLSQGLRS